MPFLREIQRVQPREEHRIQIHIQQVAEILAVLGGEGVGGPVRTGEGVHKGVERAAEHHEEGITHRVALAATQRGVLENVRDPGGVFGHRAQCHHEYVFCRVTIEMQMGGAGARVLVFLDG